MTAHPIEPPPHGDIDWDRVGAMTEGEVLAGARSDPDAQPLGDISGSKPIRMANFG